MEQTFSRLAPSLPERQKEPWLKPAMQQYARVISTKR